MTNELAKTSISLPSDLLAAAEVAMKRENERYFSRFCEKALREYIAAHAATPKEAELITSALAFGQSDDLKGDEAIAAAIEALAALTEAKKPRRKKAA